MFDNNFAVANSNEVVSQKWSGFVFVLEFSVITDKNLQFFYFNRNFLFLYHLLDGEGFVF